MKLAVAFWFGQQPELLESTLDRLEGIGVKGLGHINVGSWERKEIQRFSEGFAARDCFISEVTVYQYGWPLTSPDESVRREAIAALGQGLEDAVTLHAHCLGVSVIADSKTRINPWSDEVWTRLVEGTGEVAAQAEHLGVDMAFHPGNRGPLDAPDQLRRLLDEVKSPRVKVILDPVNMTNHRTYHASADFINYSFDLLGRDIISAHAKDILLDDGHWVLKLDEVPLGMGNLDYETYVRRMGELEPGAVFTIEHYRDVGVSGTVRSPVYVKYPDTDWENTWAVKFIHALAQEVGVQVS